MTLRRIALIPLLILVVFSSASAARGYKTRHVLVITMDGTRLAETFGDPEHRLVPNLWNELRPQGTIYTNFLNTGITVTRQGHSSIASGTWQRVPNGGPRLTRPTFFEYLRDEKRAPAGAAWAIFGKAGYSFEPYSSFPTYGKNFAPESAIGLGEAEEGDEHVLAKVKEVFAKDHPALAFINLGCTDHFGHGADFERYRQAVATADRVIAGIWAAAQADPEMRGTTTMIATNDHGRHDDAHGGYTGHGDTCSGCQRLMFLIVGPDTKAGAIVEREGTLIDICPTVGELLGFQTPLAEGRVLSECFLDYQGLNKKKARTPAAREGLDLLALVKRDPVATVGGSLAKRAASLLYDPAGVAACLGLLSTGDASWREKVKSWATRADAPDNPTARAARARVLAALDAKAYQQQIRELTERLPQDEMPPDPAARALILDALAWGEQKKGPAAVAMPDGFSAKPAKPDPLVLFLLADAAAARPRRPVIAQAALLHLNLALKELPEFGAIWPDTTASCLNLASLRLLQQSGWLRGFQAADPKQRGKEQNERSAVPEILASLPQPIRGSWLPGKGEKPVWAMAQRIWYAGKYAPFSLERLQFTLDAKGRPGGKDDPAAAGGYLIALKDAREMRRGAAAYSAVAADGCEGGVSP